ncbi:MAG: LacI family DNA-binding transcriptional regulator [Chthoniobacterales bacterium]
MTERPTIRSLAKIAGVSNATISLALRNHPRIRASERERIQRIAAEAGYQTNALLSYLTAQMRMNNTSYQSTLGLLCVSEESKELKTVSTFRDWISSCREGAKQLGYGMDQFVLCDEKLPPMRLVKILEARGIRGLLIIGPFPNNELPADLQPVWERWTSVVLGIRPINPALAFVANDQFSTAARAMRELLQLGYRRPGLCIHPDVDDLVENRFLGGFLVEQSHLCRKDRISPFSYQPSRQEQFQAWVRRSRPDVILTLHPEVKKWIEHMGMNIPRDIGLVHLDKTAELKSWAGMQQNNQHIGRAAVDMLVGQLHRNEAGVPQVQRCTFISGIWNEGSTICRQGIAPVCASK